MSPILKIQNIPLSKHHLLHFSLINFDSPILSHITNPIKKFDSKKIYIFKDIIFLNFRNFSQFMDFFRIEVKKKGKNVSRT